MEAVKELGRTDAIIASNFILKNYGPMSHLKLQKLLYYSQAYHLAYFDKELFPEDFEAWMHGPVCRRVFRELRGASVLYSDVNYSASGSDPDTELNTKLASEQLGFLILAALVRWSGLELESATHSEFPWLKARNGFGPADACSVVIDKEDMRTFYKKDLIS